MSMHDTDLDRYCPIRTDINGEMRKCVKGCAWWWNGSCSVTRISYHLEMLQSGLDETNVAVDYLHENVSDLITTLEQVNETNEQETGP